MEVSSARRGNRRAGRSLPEASQSTAKQSSVPTLRVLWIDDEPGVIASLSRFLTTEGWQVESANDGATGLALARTRSYDVILLDLVMPGLSGLDVLDALRRDAIETPVIVLTAYGTYDLALEAGRLGAAEFKAKPMRGLELVQTIRSIVAGRRVPRVGGPDSPEDTSPAGRWAWHVWRPSVLRRDPKTEAIWAAMCHTGVTTLYEISRRLKIPLHDARDLARILFALREHQRTGQALDTLLDIQDPRTLKGLYERAGISDPQHPPSVEDFLTRQTFVPANGLAIAALRRLAGLTVRP